MVFYHSQREVPLRRFYGELEIQIVKSQEKQTVKKVGQVKFGIQWSFILLTSVTGLSQHLTNFLLHETCGLRQRK